MADLQGVHLKEVDGTWTVEHVSLKELLWREADCHDVYNLYNNKTLIFNGNNFMGNSEFGMALACELAAHKTNTAIGWDTLSLSAAMAPPPRQAICI